MQELASFSSCLIQVQSQKCTTVCESLNIYIWFKSSSAWKAYVDVSRSSDTIQVPKILLFSQVNYALREIFPPKGQWRERCVWCDVTDEMILCSQDHIPSGTQMKWCHNLPLPICTFQHTHIYFPSWICISTFTLQMFAMFLENTLICFNYGCDTSMFIHSAGICN